MRFIVFRNRNKVHLPLFIVSGVIRAIDLSSLSHGGAHAEKPILLLFLILTHPPPIVLLNVYTISVIKILQDFITCSHKKVCLKVANQQHMGSRTSLPPSPLVLDGPMRGLTTSSMLAIHLTEA